MKIERRSFLRGAGAVAALAVPISLVLQRHGRVPALAAPRAGSSADPRALVPDPEGLFDLPSGFRYHVIERRPAKLSDGHRLPGAPDGMACFAGPNGTFVLMRNHELDRTPELGPFEGEPHRNAYDPEAAGGVTRVVIDARTLERISSNLVLAGTLRNCACGPSPWGFLTCEESVAAGHGYVFLCDPAAETIAPPRKITGYGRFNHEAVCIDPETHVAYLTEDRPDGCLYRFVPRDPAHPFEGRLEALAIVGSRRFDTGLRFGLRQPRPVEWVPVPDPDPREDTVRKQAHEQGAAVIRRGEGIWYHDGAVYFSATSGGLHGTGQIFRLLIGRDGAGDRLELFAESTDSETLDCPDNITVAPWGDVYIAEDGPGEQYVRGITPDGRVFDLGRNAHSRGELTGVCFSPDGSALFVNLQREGVTLAIRGPFQRLSAPA